MSLNFQLKTVYNKNVSDISFLHSNIATPLKGKKIPLRVIFENKVQKKWCYISLKIPKSVQYHIKCSDLTINRSSQHFNNTFSGMFLQQSGYALKRSFKVLIHMANRNIGSGKFIRMQQCVILDSSIICMQECI